jgi:hypothetical protein
MKFVKLPDRNEITLREAVTAFVFGECPDASYGRIYPSRASDVVLQELTIAAKAGRIKFWALRVGSSKYQEIDDSYFNTRFEFDWNENCIQAWCLADEEMGLEGGGFGIEWHEVYLDRHGFSDLLKQMGVNVSDTTVPATLETDAPANTPTYTTGAAGRPTSMHFALIIAERLLKTEGYPDSKLAFARRLAAELKTEHPLAAPLKPKTMSSNPDFIALLHRYLPKKIDVT